jgi:hypothetical protein
MVDLIIIVVGSIIITGYFAYNHGMRRGVEFGTELTIEALEREGIIHIDAEGNVGPKKKAVRRRSA